MTTNAQKISAILLAFMLLVPFLSYADTTVNGNCLRDDGTTTTGPCDGATTTAPSGASLNFKRQGIFDCNQNGAHAMSVGALSAIGGAYVPVADAAVELNTGTLVYKECVLREVVDREREAALAAFLKQFYQAIQSGRNGSAMYVQKSDEIVRVSNDPTALKFLQGPTLDALSPELRAPIRSAVAKSYEVQRSSRQNALTCPYARNSGSIWDSVLSIGSVCNPIIAYPVAEELMGTQLAIQEEFQRDQWAAGRGFYSVVDENGNIVTPASVVQESFQQMLGSSVRQLENANDIGQMIGALYAGITTQVVGDSRGLPGLSQSVGGQLSYLNQIAAESAQGLQGAATNAALQILGAAQQVETAYLQAVSAMSNSLAQASTQLKDAERQCWAAIIPRVCATPLSAQSTCTAIADPCTTNPSTGEQTCPTPVTLKVATSTAFSNAIINVQIAPLTAPAANNISVSQRALQLLNNLIQGITNTASLNAQRVALTQLDSLVAQRALHTQTDLATVSQQQQTVSASMTNLVQTTVQNWTGVGSDSSGNIAWDGTTNPALGWCNINNSATLASWRQLWKQ